MDGFIISINDLRHRSRRNEEVSYCTFDSTLKTRRTTKAQNVSPELLLKMYQAYQRVINLVRSFLSGYKEQLVGESLRFNLIRLCREHLSFRELV